MPLCGFGCHQCGRCGPKISRFGLTSIPGMCPNCNTIGNPSDTVCKKCGAILPENAKSHKHIGISSDSGKSAWLMIRKTGGPSSNKAAKGE